MIILQIVKMYVNLPVDGKKRAPDIEKFADYLDRKFNINHIKPHQVCLSLRAKL